MITFLVSEPHMRRGWGARVSPHEDDLSRNDETTETPGADAGSQAGNVPPADPRRHSDLCYARSLPPGAGHSKTCPPTPSKHRCRPPTIGSRMVHRCGEPRPGGY